MRRGRTRVDSNNCISFRYDCQFKAIRVLPPGSSIIVCFIINLVKWLIFCCCCSDYHHINQSKQCKVIFRGFGLPRHWSNIEQSCDLPGFSPSSIVLNDDTCRNLENQIHLFQIRFLLFPFYCIAKEVIWVEPLASVKNNVDQTYRMLFLVYRNNDI